MECATCHSQLINDAAYCPHCGGRQAGTPECDVYDYAAFVSYRHREPDATVAATIHRAIERYRLPREVARVYGAQTLGRAFRDQEELAATSSLPAAIRDALRHSRTLIVICSPATPQSRWVAQEIELFASFHGRERIFAVLADGTSAESMPEALRYGLQVNTQGEVWQGPTEPLAADMRSSATQRSKQETLRIIAAIAGCTYDDLRKRDRSRRTRQWLAGFIAALVATIAICALSMQAASSKDAALIEESQRLAIESSQQLSHGDRYEAIETALSALPKSSSDTSRPLVPEAQEALENALGLHPSATTPWQSSYSLATEHTMGLLNNTCMTQSPDAQTIGVSTIVVCETEGYFAVSDDEGAVRIYELDTGKLRVSCILPESATPTKTGEYLRVLQPAHNVLVVANPASDTLVGIDSRTGKVLWTMESHAFATLVAAPDAHTVYGTEFSTDGGFALWQIDAATGSITPIAADRNAAFAGLAHGTLSAMDDTGSRCCTIVGNKLVSVDCTTGKATTAQLAFPEAAALACYGPITLVGTVEAYDGQELELRYTIEAFDEKLQKMWEYTGNLASEMIHGENSTTLVLGWPGFNGSTASRNDAVVCVGRSVYVFNLESGEPLYEHDFASTVLEVQPWSASDGAADRLFIVCADGSIVVENPESPTRNYDGDQFRFQLEEAIRWSAIAYRDGVYTWLSASAETDNRLVAFKTGLTYGTESNREYALDELLALAQSALGDRNAQ